MGGLIICVNRLGGGGLDAGWVSRDCLVASGYEVQLTKRPGSYCLGGCVS